MPEKGSWFRDAGPLWKLDLFCTLVHVFHMLLFHGSLFCLMGLNKHCTAQLGNEKKKNILSP